MKRSETEPEDITTNTIEKNSPPKDPVGATVDDNGLLKLMEVKFCCTAPNCVESVVELINYLTTDQEKTIGKYKTELFDDISHCSTKKCHEVYYYDTRGKTCDYCSRDYCEQCFQTTGRSTEDDWFCSECKLIAPDEEDEEEEDSTSD